MNIRMPYWTTGSFSYDNLQRPDNRPDERFDKKSKSCCTDEDAAEVEYKMVVPEGAKYPEPEWYM